MWIKKIYYLEAYYVAVNGCKFEFLREKSSTITWSLIFSIKKTLLAILLRERDKKSGWRGKNSFVFPVSSFLMFFSHKLMNWRRPLDTVLGCQPLLERNWELVRKLSPSLISHLGFEPVQDFVKHVLQFRMRVLPRGDGVTKVDEVLHHSWKKVTRNFIKRNNHGLGVDKLHTKMTKHDGGFGSCNPCTCNPEEPMVLASCHLSSLG